MTAGCGSGLDIVLLSHYYPPEFGACPRRMRSLVSRWTERGARVRVVAPIPHYPHGRTMPSRGWADVLRSETGEHGERIRRVPFLPTSRGGGAKLADHIVVAAASLPAAVLGHRPDVVVATVPAVPTMGTALVAARRWRAPLVLDMRDSWPDVAVEAGMAQGRVGRTLVDLVSYVQRRADAIVTVPPGFAASLEARGIPGSRIHHIANGTDISGVPLQAPPPERRERLRVLYCGTHGVSQGLDVVIRALAEAREVVEARFIGEGTEKAALVDLARRLDAPVRFEGAIPRDHVWDAYGWADTCLVPLRDWPSFRDAVPSKLYEIMASGRHVLASLSGEAERVLAAAGGGTVVPPDDHTALVAALHSLARDRSRLVVGSRSREWVRANRDDDTLADLFYSVLESAVAGRHGAGARRVPAIRS